MEFVRVKNKAQSDAKIKKLGFNRMVEGVFTKDDTEKLIKFLDEMPVPFYNIRDKTPMGQFLYKITREEVLERSKNYEKFAVYESLAEADLHLILQGDVLLTSDFQITASLSDIKGISNRNAMQNPKYKVFIDLKKEAAPDIQSRYKPTILGLKKIIDFIAIHELINVYVEFSLFDIPVGVNQENIIIWELRNY